MNFGKLKMKIEEESYNSRKKLKTQGKNSTFGEQTLRLWHQVMLKQVKLRLTTTSRAKNYLVQLGGWGGWGG